MSPVTDISTPDVPALDPAVGSPLEQTRQTLQQAIARYTLALQKPDSQADASASANLRVGLERLETLRARLDSHTLKVAVFGLVSRGKSAVINAVLGKPVLETGPLHGVTRWPRSVYWQPDSKQQNPEHLSAELPNSEQPNNGSAVEPARGGSEATWQVEFIDTPGLDEIEGAVRAEMAQTVAHQADLILFVVAGDITPIEYEALQTLQAAQKPLLLVFNKIDLYPDVDREAIYAALNALRQETAALPTSPLAVEDVLRVAADPAPFQVRVEWPDGRIAYEWEKPPAQIDALRLALQTLLHQDGSTLIALNTLRQARDLEVEVVSQVSDLHQNNADELIWRFARYKALAVALNPVAVLDLLGGAATDLVMIRSLSKLYGFPITNYRASQLWSAILRSSGGLLLGELAGMALGAGKTTAALFSLSGSPASLTALGSALVAQAGTAGYGTYVVGQATKHYLEQGCTWGPEGMSRVMQTILAESKTSTTLARLRQTLQTQLSQSS
ncbi:MAG TPA: GTP-binding protein [Trichocoleus sp.]